MSILLHYEGDINVRVAPIEPYDIGISPPRTKVEMARIMGDAGVKGLNAVLTARHDEENGRTVIHVESQPGGSIPSLQKVVSAIGCALSEPFRIMPTQNRPE